MDPNKPIRLEFAGHIRNGFPQEIRAGLLLEQHIVALGMDRNYFTGVHKQDSALRLDRNLARLRWRGSPWHWQSAKQLHSSPAGGSLGSSVQSLAEPLGREGLEHVIDGLFFEGGYGVFRVRGYKDDGRKRVFGLLEPGDQFDTGHLGHVNVQQQHVVGGPSELLEGLNRVTGGIKAFNVYS